MKAVGYAPPVAKLDLCLGCTVAAKEAAAAGTEKGQTMRNHKRLTLPSPSLSRRRALLVAVANLVATRSAVSEEVRQKETLEAVITKQELLDLVRPNWLWGRLFGSIGVAGSLWLVAAKPIVSSAVQRLEKKGPTRTFMLESRMSRALTRKYEAHPIRSGRIPLLDRKEKRTILETCKWSQGALILCGPSNTGKTTLVMQALAGRTNVIVVQLRQYRNNLVEGLKEALGLGRSEETSLLEIVLILRKLWENKRGGNDVPVIFIDDAHLLGDMQQLLLDKNARADLQLLLEIAWAGLGYVIMGASGEAGAEVLIDQVSGGPRVGVFEYTFPSKRDVLSYLEEHLKCSAEVSSQIYTCVGGHLGEVGMLVAGFQGSRPSSSEIAVYLARREELAANKIKRALQGRVADPTRLDASTRQWAFKILNEIKDHPQRRSALEISSLDSGAEKENILEKLGAADKLVQVNVLRRNLDGTYSFHSPLDEYAFVKKVWLP